jgi:hypothetical protein
MGPSQEAGRGVASSCGVSRVAVGGDDCVVGGWVGTAVLVGERTALVGEGVAVGGTAAGTLVSVAGGAEVAGADAGGAAQAASSAEALNKMINKKRYFVTFYCLILSRVPCAGTGNRSENDRMQGIDLQDIGR